MAPANTAHIDARLDRQDAREQSHFRTVVGLIVTMAVGLGGALAEMRVTFADRLARLETAGENLEQRLDRIALDYEQRLRAVERGEQG